jgi:hypothetical protein
MPEQLVKNVAGEVVFEQTQPNVSQWIHQHEKSLHVVCLQVWPIANYPVQDVCLASQRLVHEHNTQFQGKAKIIMQV